MNPVIIETLSLRFNSERNPQLQILDQQLLPQSEVWLDIRNTDDMIAAIKALKVRGAPLIGVAASLSLAQTAQHSPSVDFLLSEAQRLMESRPTAVNLMNCVQRLIHTIQETNGNPQAVLRAAHKITLEDIELCDRMAEFGAQTINDGDNILTHCNTGSLATAGVGTALGVIRKAHQQGKRIHVYVDETRPLLQGGRLTTYELEKLKIPYTLITDNMAAHLMSLGKIQKIYVGCDRIAANGDFANKIGTYSVAVSAHYHKVPFYVVGPQTTVDPHCPSGTHIPIEQRAATEVQGVFGAFGNVVWAPEKSKVYNPSFDVTPANLVTGWILDTGIFHLENIKAGLFERMKK